MILGKTTSDGYRPYIYAVDASLSDRLDYGMLVKQSRLAADASRLGFLAPRSSASSRSPSELFAGVVIARL